MSLVPCSEQRRSLIADVARGMVAIHACGFVWGDCKPDNVLIFPNEDSTGKYIAKLCDFGACLVQASDIDSFLAYSPPWTAPEQSNEAESFGRGTAVRGLRSLQSAEIYSFGLIVWTIATDGHQFDEDFWCDGEATATSSSERVSVTEIEKVKCDKQSPTQLLEIAERSVRQYLRGFSLFKRTYRPRHQVASSTDINFIITLLQGSLQQKPEDRAMGMDKLAHLLTTDIFT